MRSGGWWILALGIGATLRAAALVRADLVMDEMAAFRLDPSQIRHTYGGSSHARMFFDELLPACFERTMRIDRWGEARGRVDWIFTGPRAGLTLQIDSNGVQIVRRQYDSSALAADKPGLRHPEKRDEDPRIAVPDTVRTVTLTLDHRLSYSVRVNGTSLVTRLWMHDLVRHQAIQQGGGAIVARMLRPAARDVPVRVMPDRRRQTIVGFGGITVSPSYRQLSEEGKRQWWSLLKDYNLLLHREYPIGSYLNESMDNWDRIEDAVPHYYGDNFPNSEICDFDYLKRLRAIGGMVMFEFWKLPPWADKDVDRYAAAVVSYCRRSKERAGAPPEIVGIQNEVRQPAEKFQRMTLALRKALDDAGFQGVKIHMADSSKLKEGLDYLRDFRAKPEVWDRIDYAAAHMYDFQNAFTDPDSFDALMRQFREGAGGKPVISTELCVNDGRFQTDSYRVALQMGQLYHKNLAIVDAVAVAYCWLLLNVEQPTYGMTRSLFVPDMQRGGLPAASSAQLRVFGAFSRRIANGMVRVETGCNDPDLLVTAFAGAKGAVTLVAFNRSSAPARIAVDWPGVNFNAVEECGPYAPNLPVAADSRVVPPGGILTLTGGR